MERQLQKSKHWWRVPLLLLVCLLGGSGTVWGGAHFYDGGTYITHHPSVDEPWIVVRVMFYDPNGKDGYFTHEAAYGNAKGPAVWVDGNYVCSPDWQLSWYGSGSGNSEGVEKERGVEEWWGQSDCMSYTNSSADGQTYLVKFWNPGKSGAGQYTCYMYVYLTKYHVGGKHTVKIRGKWKINNGYEDWEEVNLTTNAFASPYQGTPSAVMTEYGKMAVSGNLNANHGPTWVGTRDDATWGDLTMVDPSALCPETKQYPYNTASFSNLSLPFTRTEFWNNQSKPVEFVIKENVTHNDLPVAERPDVSIYQWYNISVPGFVKPIVNTSYTADLWNKSITITWESDESGNRCKNGTWSVYRDGTFLTSNIEYDTKSYTDTSSDLNYDTDYEYTVYFVPTGTPSGTSPQAKLSHKVTAKLLRPDKFFNDDNFKATNNLNDKIVVTWAHNPIAKASSVNAYQLVLERSTDKVNWQEVQTFQIKDPEQTSGSYEDSYELHPFTTYYYRLKITVFGKSYLSGHTSGALEGMSKVTAFSASRGSYTNVVKLKWDVNQVGNSTTYFTLYRRPLGSTGESGWAELTTLSGTDASYNYDDVTAQIGSFNEYKVSVWMMNGQDRVEGMEAKCDGFSMSTGTLGGHITYGTGVAVQGAKVTLKRQSGGSESTSGMHSLKITGPNNGLVCHTDEATIKELFAGDFTIQAYLKPDNNVTDGMNIHTGHFQFCNVPGVFDVQLK